MFLKHFDWFVQLVLSLGNNYGNLQWIVKNFRYTFPTEIKKMMYKQKVGRKVNFHSVPAQDIPLTI